MAARGRFFMRSSLAHRGGIWIVAGALAAGGADQVVGHGAEGEADEGHEQRCEDVVPAGAGHFAFAEDDRCEQEFERDPGDVENRWRDASLNALNHDVTEAEALEFAGESLDVAQLADDPAVAEPAEDLRLRAAQFARAKKAVGDDDAAARAEQAAGLAQERGLAVASGVAGTLDGEDRVERSSRVSGVLVVAESEDDVGISGLVEKPALFELPGTSVMPWRRAAGIWRAMLRSVAPRPQPISRMRGDALLR